MAEHIMRNPIMPGFYPDPSICRVGDDYYLANSSFGLFPGVPVFKSKDLVNWELICNSLDRVDQHYVNGASVNGGIMAPTIRYHDGVFYIIVANFHAGGNIMITATNPAGPWSDPYYLSDVPGIDASIFFDDDGKCYAHGTGSFDKDGKLVEDSFRNFGSKNIKRGIWAVEFDVKTMKTVGEKKHIWDSALIGAASPEAPHLYKKDGWYYLLIAEGGTEHFHAVTFARSREVISEYEGFKGNPVLTHRHLGYDYPIANVGHADIVELPDGSWYAVMLGSRFLEGYHKNLGRETCICPVIWQNDWPVFSPLSGKVDMEYPAPACLPWTPVPAEPAFDDFEGDKLADYWCCLGTPKPGFWEVHDSRLELTLNERAITDAPEKMMFTNHGEHSPKAKQLSYVCRRQRQFDFDFTARMSFIPKKDGEAAGILLNHGDNDFYIESAMDAGKHVLRVRNIKATRIGSFLSPDSKVETEITDMAGIESDANDLVLRISERGHELSFWCGKNAGELTSLASGGDARTLNIPVDGGMCGALLGMYATGGGVQSKNTASFDWAEYRDYT